MLVALDRIFSESSINGIKDVIIAMPHRGRLNLLTQLLSLDLKILIKKLKGHAEISEGLLSETPAYTGDVLSHLSNTSILNYQNPLKVHVLPNPSHLEAVSPVGLGFTRALSMVDRTGPYNLSTSEKIGKDSLSVQIHGDAAFGGQGVVAETLNLSKKKAQKNSPGQLINQRKKSTLPHFTVGGSIRLVLNNQLGYTTPATEGRTAFYATDIGKSIEAPIIHVNGEYPEEVSKALSLAVAFRNKFRKDVLVDLVVYRRWGHNELDEPTYTSPHMYRKIQSLISVPKRYERELTESDLINEEQISKLQSKIEEEFGAALDDRQVQQSESQKQVSGLMDLKEFSGNQPDLTGTLRGKNSDIETGVELSRLRAAGEASVSLPKDFNVHPRLQKMHIQKRLQALSDKTGNLAEIDYSTAEALAFGTILEDGYDIRLSGQDSGRGTFSQRHALLTDQVVEGRTIVPLNQLSDKNSQRGNLEIVNSPLSEYAVLGFELGLSYLTSRSCLTFWEAQFGDFVNTAQVAVDQFFVSGQFKWPTFDTGLVLLLPHGLDGAGPEHSSCKPERFLQASNEPYRFESRLSQQGKQGHNISVCNPSTPAQYFHLLRRQIKYTKVEDPRGLVICTPKTILRLRESFSCLNEMKIGTSWNEVIDDGRFQEDREGSVGKEHVEKILLCSGKLYYDLIKKRKSLGKEIEDRVGIIRVEELTPFPYKSLHKIIKSYANVKSVSWVQEEPENSGPLNFVFHRIQEVLNKIEDNEDDPFNESLLSKKSASKIQSDISKRKGIELSFIARPSCASSATGISLIYKDQKKFIEDSSFLI
ncbi:Transketolase, pyrimidine binding domain-domain-containing protein [Phakopsora pachyrhizi]|uniref:Transketolase, pyrimidine binding domain-domain-containing protein n=1 Tax=Phakopsora pachyrhizi TaxID=170000 RepID=A0AAV0B3F8_PHAPC|nr:Transketolase, pyrimidine binding domain-domain-containing protein [Phakopsora pachyrhizi]